MSETELFAGHRSAPGMAHLRYKAGSAGAQIGAEISTGRLDARTALAVARMCGDVLVEIDPELCEALLADIELAARRAMTQARKLVTPATKNRAKHVEA